MTMRPGLVVGLYFALCLTLTGCAATPSTAPLPDAWQTACTYSKYAAVCANPNLASPIILVTRTTAQDAYGTYHFGDDYIKVRPGLPPKLQLAVVVHEMVHYLQWASGKEYNSFGAMCAAEHEAFDVSARLEVELGLAPNTWEDIRGAYGCPLEDPPEDAIPDEDRDEPESGE